MRHCICGSVKEQRYGTRKFFVHDLNIQIHHLPHFLCDRCKNATYDVDTDPTTLLKIAFKLRMTEVDWRYRNSINIVFQFDAAKEVKDDIQKIINHNIDSLNNEEPFAIMYGSKIIVGQRLSNFIAVQKMIDKVL